MNPPAYIGRFAPSPTGPLHLGSLLAALASYLDAKAQQGQWLLRLEDIDPPRQQPGASEAIIASLAVHGLHHDGDIEWQHQNSQRYLNCLEQLKQRGLIFPCRCSRQQLRSQAGIHCGRCHTGQLELLEPGWAWRLDISQAPNPLDFIDQLQGQCQQNLKKQVGDFVLRRKDMLFAYQLAVVCDDIAQGVTHIVRGIDLLDSSQRQLYLYQCLGQTPPHYSHIPVIVNQQGQKLSKQNHAPALDANTATTNIYRCLQLLQQRPPQTLAPASLTELLQWAVAHWQPLAMAGITELSQSNDCA